MKRLFFALFLLIAAPAYGQYVRDDCSTITPPATFKGTCYDYGENKFKYWDGDSWEDITSGGGAGTPGGSDTQVQYNDGGSFGGDAGLTFNETTNVLTVAGDVIVGSQSVCLEDGTNCPAAGAGDIEGVTAGNGLTGGGTSGTVTLNVGATSPITVAADAVECATCAVTSGTLGQFAATTSAQLAGVISNETGTGVLVLNDTPTILTPSITGAIAFQDDVRQTFNPGANAAGLNVGSIAGDPGTPSNGDLWYDSTANELTARINGSNVALGAGGGGGDITDVWGCTTGNCNALTGAAGDSLDAGSADASSPATRSTSLPGTCSEGQMHQDTDSGGTETYICTSANTWTKLIAATDNVATASALAANGANCSAGSAPLGVDASGAAESCTDYMEEPASSGLVAKTAANTSAARTITGTANRITVTDGNGVSGDPTLTVPDSAQLHVAKLTNLTSNGFVKTGSGDGTLSVDTATYLTATSTATLTEKTLDAEASGNVITIPRRIWLPAAGCNNATAGSIWDLPSSSPAVAACVTGTNTQKGVLDFADSANLSAQLTYKLPSTWTGALDANIKWLSSTTSGDVVWQLSTICVADAETDDPAFNTASTVTDTTKGTTNQTNDAAITGVTTTGCAAGELMHLKIQRDSGHASDNMAGTARLIGVELVIREAM